MCISPCVCYVKTVFASLKTKPREPSGARPYAEKSYEPCPNVYVHHSKQRLADHYVQKTIATPAQSIMADCFSPYMWN